MKDLYIAKNKKSINQTFNINPKIQLNLLLNFESYDFSTQYEDLYFPEEKLIKFNIGYLKLMIKGGKLRITQERENGKAKPHNRGMEPYGAFSIVEDDGKLKFDYI